MGHHDLADFFYARGDLQVQSLSLSILPPACECCQTMMLAGSYSLWNMTRDWRERTSLCYPPVHKLNIASTRDPHFQQLSLWALISVRLRGGLP